LRVVFPEIPRCELTDLVRDYRCQFQCLNRLAIERLTWHSPRRVWAMDHADPPSPIDNEYASIFTVRDLSSGTQLAWLPVLDETAKTTCDALLALFIEYGPPLVLKSDNGSGFKSHRLAALLDHWQVVPLRSPPVTPRYNGSCEAGVGAMKTRTHYRAAEQGRPGMWTCEDLEVARRRANEEHHPRGHTRPTPLGEWQTSAAIDANERQAFRQLIDRIRHELEEDRSFAEKEIPTRDELAKLKRDVVRRALVESGILSTKWRSIAVPVKPR